MFCPAILVCNILKLVSDFADIIAIVVSQYSVNETYQKVLYNTGKTIVKNFCDKCLHTFMDHCMNSSV